MSRDSLARCLRLLMLAVVFGTGCQRAPVSESSQKPAAVPTTPRSPASGTRSSASQRFRFYYDVQVIDLPKDQTVRVWIPVPRSSAHQRVTEIGRQLPAPAQSTTEALHGNPTLYLETQAAEDGTLDLQVTYDIERWPVDPRSYPVGTPAEAQRYLAPNRLVPKNSPAVQRWLDDMTVPDEPGTRARVFFDRIREELVYAKPEGEPWGRGDVAWVCDAKFGNCTDYHSLFLALCRSTGIPAQFEIGFPIDLESSGPVAGYHCWAWFLAEGHWHPVDISAADLATEHGERFFGQLPADRITMTRGRDLQLEPPQAAEPLNFWVHPYVEVEGQPHTTQVTRYRVELQTGD